MYFDSFRIKHVSQKVLNKIEDKSMIYNIFRIQSDGSLMGGFYWTIFIEYITVGKTLLYYTNLFSPNDYEKWQDNT